jgi:hypothetical protein
MDPIFFSPYSPILSMNTYIHDIICIIDKKREDFFSIGMIKMIKRTVTPDVLSS